MKYSLFLKKKLTIIDNKNIRIKVHNTEEQQQKVTTFIKKYKCENVSFYTDKFDDVVIIHKYLL